MEVKKKDFVDLDNKRGLYMSIGYVITLLLVIMAFEWKSETEPVTNLGVLETRFEETIEIPQTNQDVPPPPPPTLAQPDIIEISNQEIIKQVDMNLSTEINDQTVIESTTPIVDDVPKEEIVSEIFVAVEEPQSFPGGKDGIADFLKQNIQYPEMARSSGIEGRVFVQFVVNEKGSIDDVQVLKGIGGGCDEEAVRVVKLMKWNPGKQRGKPVKVRMSLPIKFMLG